VRSIRAWPGIEVPSFCRMGSWIGGDRDGNPFVTAEVTRQALAMQGRRALAFHLAQLHLLGAELPIDGRMVEVSDALQALADKSPDTATSGADEPYRRRLTGMYARLAATAAALSGSRRPSAGRRRAGLRKRRRAEADLDTIHESLAANDLAGLARGRLRAMRRAVDVFGLPSRLARHPAELRRARARDERAGRHRRRGRELPRHGRGGPGGAAVGRTRQPARAGDARRRLWRGDRQRARHAAGRGRCPSPLRAEVDPALRDFQGRFGVGHPRGSRCC
jgi:hypothetical protein